MEYNQMKHGSTSVGDGAIDAVAPGAVGSGIGKIPKSWDLEVDVVVIGAGAAGLSAAIKAADAGASVIVVETNYDIGGHAIISGGTALIRPLEVSARTKGVRFLLNYKMTSLVREPGSEQKTGRLIGVTARYMPRILPGQTTPLKSFRSDGNIETTQSSLAIRAKKSVILATGGSTSNVNFRRMFDPRLTDVLQVAGEPYTFQDGSGELAAMAIGASLWGLANQILENGDNIRTKRALATRYNYMTWELESPIFPLVRATGLNVKDWQDLILVNQVGKRFYDETKGDYPHGN